MSSLPPDPWQVLGLAKCADKTEIRSAYRKLVLRCHPDKVQDPTLKAQKQDEFQKVQQAYELLNDDTERIKYEEQVRIHELRKKMASKTMSNTSASRTPPSKHYFEVRTPTETRYKPATQSTPGPTKIYAQYSSHTRSNEDTTRAYEVFDAVPRTARRTASTEYEYPKSSSRRDREDDRRDREKEDRRRRKEEEERERARKDAKKRVDKDRKQASEEKMRRHREPPYVEKFPEDVEEVYLTSSKPEKKKSSSSKKHDDARERERSTRRGERGESPKAEKLEPRKQKTNEYIEYAANYIERSKAAKASQSSPYYPPLAPSPPPMTPMDNLDESVHRSAARAASRRMSNDTPKKEKSSSRKQSSREEFEVVDAAPRPPTLSKSHTTPLSHMASGSPPRPSRSNTESFARTMPQQPPAFSRSNTWAHGEDDRTSRNTYTIPTAVYEYESEEEQPRRSHRSSRRSPEATRYKVGEDKKTSKIDAQYAYGDSPSSRRYPSGFGRSPPNAYSEAPYKVKTAQSYSVDDVKFANVAHNASTTAYNYHPTEAY